jgi:hypothetical protein
MSDYLAGIELANVTPNCVDGATAATHAACWVVESAGRLVGLAVVCFECASLARVKIVGFAPDVPDRHQVANTLFERLLRYTWESGCLKLVVHTVLPASPLIEFMHAFGFDFARERREGDERVVEFYRNLYVRPAAFEGSKHSGPS